jgi:hypothetical protein
MSGVFGQQGLTDASSEHNAREFQIAQALGKVRTGVPVKIIAVHGGGVGAAPTVDVQPMVNQIDGDGNMTAHGTIFGIAVSREAAGDGAIINDPVVGDVGHMVISDRDISSHKANAGAQSNPGSYRRHDLADGVYHRAMYPKSATPKQYVWFQPGVGITISDSNMNVITMSASKMTIKPGPGIIIYIGGDGITGSYDWIQTVSGPMTNYAKGRYA